MVPGTAGEEGVTVTASVEAELVPQLLPAVTLIFPEVLPNVTVTDVVPCPEVTPLPAGTLHV
jgi:hypothetical protein